nr:MAG TPA: hypothetical protein [Caudoviricetes sp.]
MENRHTIYISFHSFLSFHSCLCLFMVFLWFFYGLFMVS